MLPLSEYFRPQLGLHRLNRLIILKPEHMCLSYTLSRLFIVYSIHVSDRERLVCYPVQLTMHNDSYE